ncbi:hypothetical protein [Aeromonas salmonicida]|uniref:hypothetical protein n=1 Tax=Aeromonas salmonicida TaxID=645 RepID=UPI00285F7F98|nr:hypothetical protein [Aeromonas salmonicida]MDR7022432.1 hypothetical protein [Aeromonas salmonicida]
MPKRITFQADRDSTICEIDNYCRAKKLSRSAVISSLLNALVPRLKCINAHYSAAKDLERELTNVLEQQDCLLPQEQFAISAEEHFHQLWIMKIRHPRNIVDYKIHEHKKNKTNMEQDEISYIKEMLENIVNKMAVEKAIFIYTDRRVSHKFQKAGGLSNTLLINQSEYEGYFFDFANSKPLPMLDVIAHGIKEALKRHQATLPIPCVCWIPIYYVDDMVIMTPVIKSTDVKKQKLTMDKAIIINLLGQEVVT